MKNWIKNNKFFIIGAVVGAIAGFLYWQNIGCSSGTCAITSKPVNSTLYGAIMGALLADLFFNYKKKEKINKSKSNLNDI
jgi:hypothetical protein